MSLEDRRDGTGHELDGGNVTTVVRVGDTVRRTAGPWTPAVHALLAWVRERGEPREVQRARPSTSAGSSTVVPSVVSTHGHGPPVSSTMES